MPESRARSPPECMTSWVGDLRGIHEQVAAALPAVGIPAEAHSRRLARAAVQEELDPGDRHAFAGAAIELEAAVPVAHLVVAVVVVGQVEVMAQDGGRGGAELEELADLVRSDGRHAHGGATVPDQALLGGGELLGTAMDLVLELVDVRVHDPRQDRAALQIDDPRLPRVTTPWLGYRRDPAALDGDRRTLGDGCPGSIEQPGVGEHRRAARRLRVGEQTRRHERDGHGENLPRLVRKHGSPVHHARDNYAARQRGRRSCLPFRPAEEAR